LPHVGEFALAALRASAADDRRLSAWLTRAIESRSIQPRPPIKLRPDRLGFAGEVLHLDTAAFNVATVADAVILADSHLGRQALADRVRGRHHLTDHQDIAWARFALVDQEFRRLYP
jgi:hypothetical protein